MKIYYFWDAYCGWCYGFEAIFEKFLENHQDLEVEVISGELFFDKKISDFPHIPVANMKISAMFGVKFWEKYEKMLAEWKLVLNSYHAAVGFGILKNLLPKSEHIKLVSKMQKAFYIDGKSLSDAEVYVEIARDFDLDSEKIVEELSQKFSQKFGQYADFELSQKFGVRGFPTVVLEKDGEFFDLKWTATTSEDLEKNFKNILES